MIELSPVISAFFSKPLWLALVISLAVIPILKLPAVKLGLVDVPGGRKKHTIAATLVGGPAIVIAMFATLFLTGVSSDYNGMLTAVTLLFLIGLVDDKHDISAKLRLILQTLIITGALWYDNVWVGPIALNETLTIPVTYFTYPLTILIILALKNAINMLDGIDGLSSGVSLIIIGFMIALTTLTRHPEMHIILTALFGAVLGFWAHNYRFRWREKASVFMGDSGTTVLGFMIPYLIIKLSVDESNLTTPSTLLWLIAIPIWDLVAVVFKRIRSKQSPLKAGRDHIHHSLMNAGLDTRQVLHLIYTLTLTAASFGFVLMSFGLSPIESYIAFALMLFFYVQRMCGMDKRNKAEIKEHLSPDERIKKIVNFKR